MHNYLAWKKSPDAYWSIYFIIWIIYDIPSWIVFRSTYCQIRTSWIYVPPLSFFIFIVFLYEEITFIPRYNIENLLYFAASNFKIVQRVLARVSVWEFFGHEIRARRSSTYFFRWWKCLFLTTYQNSRVIRDHFGHQNFTW